MSDSRRFELSWRERPQEEASLFNPAFCGELLVRALVHYRKQTSSVRPLAQLSGAMPLPYAFLIPPLILHPGSRRALPGKANTAFASWAGENADMLSVLPDRVLRLRPVTREALLFLSQIHAITIDREGMNLGQQPLRLGSKLTATTKEVEEIRRAAALLGRWFASQGESASVLQTMGVRV
ncbi:hypothetical protein EN850_13310 [Mesorhizobium sp. M8A.F.Ca.ET.207.01.1.1]|uniref:three component ABC system middle component n=1 Tax=Mesorhizobium sp. M8A.F.Ca.ET.207.01.1.1 TaxID=2563968 RepID=UPI00109C22B7|nr:three component ABC system middle component [Mesorhizobium sp. M8A.F.Ca.ET.207.01.1.1]TGQ80255.1 hypothetical protein EN850_13310 [Mesorhizobium sp. M8A.F.Ca.ET.207.01.1.1]